MIIGISGCTALLLTGFGIDDSIAGFANQQYEEIQLSDGTINLTQAMDRSNQNSLVDKLAETAENYDFVSETSWDLVEKESIKSVKIWFCLRSRSMLEPILIFMTAKMRRLLIRD